MTAKKQSLKAEAQEEIFSNPLDDLGALFFDGPDEVLEEVTSNGVAEGTESKRVESEGGKVERGGTRILIDVNKLVQDAFRQGQRGVKRSAAKSSAAEGDETEEGEDSNE